MKIGWVSEALPYVPSSGGFRLYGANLIRELSKNHTVDLVSMLREDDAKHLDWPRQYCSLVETIPIGGMPIPLRVLHSLYVQATGFPLRYRFRMKGVLRKLAAKRAWDVLHVEGAYIAGIMPEDLSIPRVLSVHDSWTLRCEEMLKCSQSFTEKTYYRILRQSEPRYERTIYPRYEAVTVVAAPDLKAVRETVPHANVFAIPYGTDTEYFNPMPVKKEPNTLVFHSHLGYGPNIEAAIEFAKEIFPIVQREAPDVVFHLIGADPGPRIQELATRHGIKVSANLPDLRAAVCSGGIYVCAIRHGTGLKSKMLEAMAMRMPIVAYHPGSTVGIDCIYGKHLLAATNPQEFAAHVLDLLRNPKRAEQLAAAARELVCEKYSWDSRARAYQQLYQQVIDQRPARSNGRKQASSHG